MSGLSHQWRSEAPVLSVMGILGDAWPLDNASGEYSFTQRLKSNPFSNSKGFPVERNLAKFTWKNVTESNFFIFQ